MISIIIATKNRPIKIRDCLRSIFYSTYKNFEVVILDQSDNNLTKSIVNKYHNKKIHYYKLNYNSKSKALNCGISKTNGETVAFTDDDCVVDKNWLENIYLCFKQKPEIVGVFGRVAAYKPNQNIDLICPCTFETSKEKIIKQPCYHATNIGFGNNMAFRKILFKKIGYFKTWLGPGSIGKAAEDAEFANRALCKGYRLCSTSKIIVFHNRWLTSSEMQNQLLSYIKGEMACYGYYAFKGFEYSKDIVKDGYITLGKRLKKYCKDLYYPKIGRNLITNLTYIYKVFMYRTLGLTIGLFFSINDRYTKLPTFSYSKEI